MDTPIGPRRRPAVGLTRRSRTITDEFGDDEIVVVHVFIEGQWWCEWPSIHLLAKCFRDATSATKKMAKSGDSPNTRLREAMRGVVDHPYKVDENTRHVGDGSKTMLLTMSLAKAFLEYWGVANKVVRQQCPGKSHFGIQ
jgi:hypothetical protein